ncbi:MAG TPA: acylphosphatase [Methanomassiliicoccales archaeon]|jgi:acylphosphatase
MKSRVEVIFKGKVQGVYFRDYTRRFAMQKEVFGWVKNLPDGTVKAVFEGDRENIEEVIRMLREEHPYARVDGMDAVWTEYRDQYDRFEIL